MRTASLPPRNAAGLLESRPDFDPARACAAEWVRAALHLVVDQEARIKELEVVKP